MGDATLMVTTAELEHDFDTWQKRALSQPVAVTNGGQPQTVIVSAEEYQRLKSRDQQALLIEELDDQTLAALALAGPPEEAALYDHEGS
jgi:PHD/YefM family antitoxin component YafN of YafNO toxin-antitoxin module